MYGAILGDIIGSPYEFMPHKSKDFELFSENSKFTDDTVLTIAICRALLRVSKNAPLDTIRYYVVKEFINAGKAYPRCGYGLKFNSWIFNGIRGRMPEPYNSFGNGSAMRVSAAGWLYDTLERTREVAKATAEVTHNHPEGIKGAEATASAIYMARTGRTKEEIAEYIIKEFGYNLMRSCDDIRPRYQFNETCQGTVPEAIICFLEGESFEDVIRNAVSLGGDADTLAAIAGSIAEGYYKIPDNLIAEADSRIPDSFKHTIRKFQKRSRVL